MTSNFDPTSIERLKELLSTPHTITLLGHVSPDGDAVGSTQALRMVLESMEHQVTVIYPTHFPASFSCIHGTDRAVIGKVERERALESLKSAEIIFCLDFNEPKRVDFLADQLTDSTATKILIDHHLHPADFVDISFSYPEVSSTSLLLYHLLGALGMNDRIHRDCAEAIYTGMMTDTGGFSYNSEDPSIYTTISDLLEKGIRKDRLTAEITRSYTVDKIRLNAHAMLNNLKILPEYHTAITTLTHREKRIFNYQVGDTEGLVNVPLEAKDIVFSIFIYEVEKFCKISFRSKGDFPTNKFAREFFNGGGHLNASGAEVYAPISEVYDLVLQALKVFHPTEEDIPHDW